MPLLDPLTSVEQALKENKIIPDIIPDDRSFRISSLFSVTWGETEVILGNELNVTDIQEEPKVQISPMGTFDVSNGVDSEALGAISYTVALLDADAPSPENRAQAPFRHWLLSGLSPPTADQMISIASSTKDIMDPTIDPLSAASSSLAISPYIPPSPKDGSGVHRYVFLLFQEPPGGIKGNVLTDSDLGERSKWLAMDFARKHHLALVGANFFTITAKTALNK